MGINIFTSYEDNSDEDSESEDDGLENEWEDNEWHKVTVLLVEALRLLEAE